MVASISYTLHNMLQSFYAISRFYSLTIIDREFDGGRYMYKRKPKITSTTNQVYYERATKFAVAEKNKKKKKEEEVNLLLR